MFSFFLSYLLIYTYVALFTVITLASFGIPLPATVLLIAAGAFAAQGYLDFSSILAFGFSASIIGDTTGYVISRRYGRNILRRIGFETLLVSPKFRSMEAFFAGHSNSAIFWSRFLVTSLGPMVNILSGLAKISYKKFLFYDILGEMLYVIIFSGLGYIFSDQWEVISQISGDVTTILVLLVLILFFVVWRIRSGRKPHVSIN